jgi:hypothetical protein
MSNKKSDSFVSLILNANNFTGSVKDYLCSCYRYLNERYTDYEIVIIENGQLGTNIAGWDQLLTEIPSIRVISVAFEINEEKVLIVGLENAIGDYVISLDQRGDPLELISSSIAECVNDIDVVTGVDASPNNTLAYRMVRPFFSKILKGIGYNLPKNSTNFFCLTRQAINVVTKAKNSHQQLYLRISQSGLGSRSISYKSIRPTPKKSILNSISELFKVLVFNSIKPLRVMTGAGILGSLLAFLIAVYSFVMRIISDDVVTGWTSLVMIISLMFFLLFIILSFLGEYMARLLEQQSNHESYWVTSERNSSVMLEETRYNVSDISE